MRHQAALLLSIAISTFLFLKGCESNVDLQSEYPYESGVHIGIIGDSQIQTTSEEAAKSVNILKSKASDILMDSAIRPPIFNYTVDSNISYFVEKIADNNPDLVFFLGDLANNGCRDEIERGVKALRDGRDRFSTPIFLVIGNHDYLAAGNSAQYHYRKSLCGGEDNFLSKFEVMEIFSSFNQESASIDGRYTYTDSLIEDPFLEDKCGKKANKNDPFIGYRGMHGRDGCFLAGILKDESKNLEVVLLDSSDYADIDIEVILDSNLMGTMGNLSKRQVEWVLDQSLVENNRIFASHYPVKSLVFNPKTFEERKNLFKRAVNPVMTTWFTAHTHDSVQKQIKKPLLMSIKDEEPKYIVEVNVGSVIDHSIHALVVPIGVTDGAGTLPHQIDSYKRIDFDFYSISSHDGFLCNTIKNELEHASIESDEYTLKKVWRKKSGHTLLGLTKDYRRIGFNLGREIISIKENYESYLLSKDGLYSKRDVDVCLGYIASLYEEEIF